MLLQTLWGFVANSQGILKFRPIGLNSGTLNFL